MAAGGKREGAGRKPGAPSKYTEKLVDEICSRLASGESLNKICNDRDMPDYKTIMRWLAVNESFRQKYADAREAQADAIFDECLCIADNATDDIMFLTSDDDDGEGGRAAIKHSAIQRARLQIDTRKWMAGKLRPKKYGDKMQHVGGDPDDGDKPIAHSIAVKFV